MPSNPSSRHDPNNPQPRDETNVEFSRRVSDLIDQDSWAGRDTVGACYPQPAKIIELPDNDERVIYKRKDGQ